MAAGVPFNAAAGGIHPQIRAVRPNAVQVVTYPCRGARRTLFSTPERAPVKNINCRPSPPPKPAGDNIVILGPIRATRPPGWLVEAWQERLRLDVSVSLAIGLAGVFAIFAALPVIVAFPRQMEAVGRQLTVPTKPTATDPVARTLTVRTNLGSTAQPASAGSSLPVPPAAPDAGTDAT